MHVNITDPASHQLVPLNQEKYFFLIGYSDLWELAQAFDGNRTIRQESTRELANNPRVHQDLVGIK